MSGKGKQTLRLDKILSHMGVGTRSELKKMVKQGRIHVDGKAVKDSGVQVNPRSTSLKPMASGLCIGR